ncbi:hypothetical protein C8R43DRAFT_1027299 [Mycena crocata]|nr:hypothetical protein C8R43DRAFT_1027299 [Mycena crocata]
MTTGGLPLELERQTFELAAELHPKTIPSLLRVAHRVRGWIEPLLYAILRLDNAELNVAFLEAVKMKPAPFLAANVRHVLLSSGIHTLEAGALESFLESCPGITSLSGVTSDGDPRILDALGSMRLQRLTADMWSLLSPHGADFSHPLFRTVTHLTVLDEIQSDGSEWLQQLSTLPALTHLGVDSDPSPEVLESILEDCPGLTVLLIGITTSEASAMTWYASDAPFRDPRVVVGMYESYEADWELGARGGEDVWVRAERFVARKIQGEIDAECYLMDTEGSPVLADHSDSDGAGSISN